MKSSFLETLKMIKIEHSVFALPFAIASAFIAAGGLPEMRTLLLILAAMVTARSAAMAFNRYLDADIDALNPRTTVRSIPAGRLSRVYALRFTVACCLSFVVVTYLINPLAFALSPVMLFVLLGYSYTKRFTNFCHLVLGLALGLAPVGAWVAVRGEIALIPILMGLAVLLWTAGFDIIYACQDEEFDKLHQLYSLPSAIGVPRSLLVSRLLHLITVVILGFLGVYLEFHWIYWIGLMIVTASLSYEHFLVRNANLEKVNTAFFTANGIVSIVFGAAVVASTLLTG